MQALHDTHKPEEYVRAIEGFPLDMMYSGQRDAIDTVRQLEAEHTARVRSGEIPQTKFSFALTSHTGSGKTAVFLALTRGQQTLVIEPRKFLQKQVAEYCHDFVMFGRSEYSCRFARNASTAPCNRRESCADAGYHTDCLEFSKSRCTASRQDACKIFDYDHETYRYPCRHCDYLAAQSHAHQVLGNNGTVICNFANFWMFLPDAETVVIDEADLFFRDISSPKRLMHIIKPPKGKEDTPEDLRRTVEELLRIEVNAVAHVLQSAGSSEAYKIQNHLFSLQFLLKNAELCFYYRRKDRLYVEISPDKVNVLKDKIFAGKRVIVVTATPSDFKLPMVSYSVWQRCGIYYCPVGLLTSRNLKMQPWILENAAAAIKPLSNVVEGLFGGKQFVIHAGNLGTHADGIVRELRNKYDGEDVCMLHTAGNLMKTLEGFIVSDKRFLVVAAAEYGADFTWCRGQFVLKVPYASYDDRMKALERTMGKPAFKQWYTMDALNRLIQQCGRVGRGYDSFGLTFILDQKFSELYYKYGSQFPQWFRNRLHDGVF
jgi:hypothetical protein